MLLNGTLIAPNSHFCIHLLIHCQTSSGAFQFTHREDLLSLFSAFMNLYLLYINIIIDIMCAC